jgi:hypothetical protein
MRLSRTGAPAAPVFHSNRLIEIVIDCLDPPRLAKFWAEALSNYQVRPYTEEDLARLASAGLTPETDVSVAVDSDGHGPILWFQKTETPKFK